MAGKQGMQMRKVGYSMNSDPPENRDDSSLHHYRTEIPNMVEEMDLSVYAFRLYVRLKRVAGDGGQCWESTRTLAAACKMSVAKISEAKVELVAAKLIVLEKRVNNQTDLITIVDVWSKNLKKYSASEGNEGCSPHEQGVRHTNKVFAIKTRRSHSEQGVRHSALKKNQLIKTNEEERDVPLPEPEKEPKKAAEAETAPLPSIPPPDAETAQIWALCLQELSAQSPTMNAWLQGSELLATATMRDGKPLYRLLVVKPESVEWLRQQAAGAITSRLRGILKKRISLEIVAELAPAAAP